ncbi:MAG: hypothetical protein SOY60_01380 [Fusobacterium gastrosuis]|uniref:hypothetical protein n=1 Tax=Fusobacterium gastrosuis TaxID=1755100 RepID=UPI002A864380|nr:hypothetical protein [Fusobacterium gastrosuis]
MEKERQLEEGVSTRVKIAEAATKLGLPQQTLRVFLQNGKFTEFGEAIKRNGSSHWNYYINRNRLDNYLQIKNEPNQKKIS